MVAISPDILQETPVLFETAEISNAAAGQVGVVWEIVQKGIITERTTLFQVVGQYRTRRGAA
ncbi:MAG: hypothetical protein JO099_14685 [Acidobacteriia bacterium]|nr:hypothetical protein [Terriglobia bacterium]